MPDYLGMSSADWAEIADAVQEGFAFIHIPVEFLRVQLAVGDIDSLYGEPVDEAAPEYTLWATLKGSVSYKPRKEVLTTLGLSTEVACLVVLPQQNIEEWEQATGLTFDVNNKDRFRVQGKVYDVEKVSADVFPVDLGLTTTSITTAVAGNVKPRGA